MKKDKTIAEPVLDEEKPIDDGKEVIKIKLNKRPVASTIFDWLGSLFIALICVLIVMSFFFRVIDVDGPSMEPTLINTDKVIITDLFYTPHQGDIVVISHGEKYDKALIKRVIATEGQTVSIKDGSVYVDDERLEEDYIFGVTTPGDRPAEETVPKGKVFVMGDNREVSLDSRSSTVGLINVTDIIGKAQIDIVPHKEGNGGIDLSKIRYLYK